MSIKLKAGLWGVSRDKQVWGPLVQRVSGTHPFAATGCIWTWMGNGHFDYEDKGLCELDIIATFKTERAAKAFAAGKPVAKEINFQRLALRLSKAKSITEVRATYRKAVSGGR